MFKFVVVAVAIAGAAAQYQEGYGGHQMNYGGRQVNYGGHQGAGDRGHQAGGYSGHQASGNSGHQESGQEDKDYHTEPNYAFAYEVRDEHTGDIKSHKEERKGDLTQGMYMVVEADGSKRVVEYVVDGKSGFNAKVQKEESEHSQEHKQQQVSGGHGYSTSGHASLAYKPHQPSHSSLSAAYKKVEQSYKPQTVYYQPQVSYKPQVAYKVMPVYKPQPTYQPSYKAESHYSQPAYKIDSAYSQPAYKAESHYSQPAYKIDSAYSQPAYKAESHYSQPAYKIDSAFSQPAYKAQSLYSGPAYKVDSAYSQPAYKADSAYAQPAYSGSGHATSSVSFATHGAKIATSTNHVVPQKQSYEPKY